MRSLGSSASAPSLTKISSVAGAVEAQRPVRRSWRDWAGREEGLTGYERGDIKRALRICLTPSGRRESKARLTVSLDESAARASSATVCSVDDAAKDLSMTGSLPSPQFGRDARFDFSVAPGTKCEIEPLKASVSIDSDGQSTEFTLDSVQFQEMASLLESTGGSLDFTFASPGRDGPEERAVVSVAGPNGAAPKFGLKLDFASIMDNSDGSLDFTFSSPRAAEDFKSLLQSSAGSFDFTFTSPRPARAEGAPGSPIVEASEELARLKAELAMLEERVLSPRRLVR